MSAAIIIGCEKPDFGNSKSQSTKVPADSVVNDTSSITPDPSPSTPGPGNTTPTGTSYSPFSVNDVLSLELDFDYEKVYIVGHIVGFVSTTSIATGATFTLPATKATNILIADSPAEDNYHKCLTVELPSGNVRSMLNLVDNPGNLGRRVKLQGTITTYYRARGIKSTKNVSFLD